MNPLDLLNPEIRALLLAEAKAQLMAEGKQIKQFDKPKKPTAKEEKAARVAIMVSRWKYRDYEAALKRYAPEIAEIQRELPGWRPTPPGTEPRD